MQKQFEKMLGKRSVLVIDKSTYHEKSHFDLFLPQYQRQKNVVFFSERELKKALRDTLTRAATLIYHGKLANQIASLPEIVVKM